MLLRCRGGVLGIWLVVVCCAVGRFPDPRVEIRTVIDQWVICPLDLNLHTSRITPIFGMELGWLKQCF